MSIKHPIKTQWTGIDVVTGKITISGKTTGSISCTDQAATVAYANPGGFNVTLSERAYYPTEVSTDARIRVINQNYLGLFKVEVGEVTGSTGILKFHVLMASGSGVAAKTELPADASASIHFTSYFRVGQW